MVTRLTTITITTTIERTKKRAASVLYIHLEGLTSFTKPGLARDPSRQQSRHGAWHGSASKTKRAADPLTPSTFSTLLSSSGHRSCLPQLHRYFNLLLLSIPIDTALPPTPSLDLLGRYLAWRNYQLSALCFAHHHQTSLPRPTTARCAVSPERPPCPFPAPAGLHSDSPLFPTPIRQSFNRGHPPRLCLQPTSILGAGPLALR